MASRAAPRACALARACAASVRVERVLVLGVLLAAGGGGGGGGVVADGVLTCCAPALRCDLVVVTLVVSLHAGALQHSSDRLRAERAVCVEAPRAGADDGGAHDLTHPWEGGGNQRAAEGARSRAARAARHGARRGAQPRARGGLRDRRTAAYQQPQLSE